MPKISVIVPVYNVEHFLRRCIDSIIKQTYQDFELICVNDCSPDNSQEILKEYEEKYPDKIKILENKINLGLGKTRERGVSVAKGQYLMFIDSDDYIKEDYLETYLGAMESCNVDVVIGGYTRDIDGKLTAHYMKESIWSLVTYPIACAKMYRRTFWDEKKLEFPEIRCGEDIYFSMELFFHKANYCVIKYAGYIYYFNSNSITGSLNYEKKQEQFVAQIFDQFMKNYDINTLSDKERKVLEYTYIANMINALITHGHGCGIKRMKKKYDFWIRDMEARFPSYRSNEFLRLWKQKGQTVKIRLGVGIIMSLQKIHCDKVIFYLLSLI